MSDIVLSILIPTLVERRLQFYNLKKRLEKLSSGYPVEILENEDNREKTTGVKRNELVDKAKGRFSAFIDDDDDVPNHYFSSIFEAIKRDETIDCIGFKGFLIDRTRPHNMQRDVFKHSKGLTYSQGKVDGMYLRPPNHLNPMLTSYFRAIRFPDKTFAEDYDFCLRLDKSGLIKNEAYLDIIMYHYQFNPKKR